MQTEFRTCICSTLLLLLLLVPEQPYDATARVRVPKACYSHTWKGNRWCECGEWRGRERRE